MVPEFYQLKLEVPISIPELLSRLHFNLLLLFYHNQETKKKSCIRLQNTFKYILASIQICLFSNIHINSKGGGSGMLPLPETMASGPPTLSRVVMQSQGLRKMDFEHFFPVASKVLNI